MLPNIYYEIGTTMTPKPDIGSTFSGYKCTLQINITQDIDVKAQIK